MSETSLLAEFVMVLVDRLGGDVEVSDADRMRVVNGKNALKMTLLEDDGSRLRLRVLEEPEDEEEQ